VRLFALIAAAAALLAGTAAAETYQVGGVRIEDAAARVEIIPENRADIDVSIQPGERVAAPRVSVADGRVLIDGDLRITGCTSTPGGGERVRIAGVGWVRGADLPRIVIRTPRTLDVSMGGAVFGRVGASNGGALLVVGCGDTDVAAVTGDLRLRVTGSGDVTVAAVSGALDAALTGSGDVRVASAGANALMRLSGSGDLTVGPVAGALDAALTGSGDLAAGNVGAGAELALTGSGDVSVREVRGALSAQLTGSGDVAAASVTGPSATLRSNASGDLIVLAGRVERLSVRSGGSGDVRFGGAAAVAEIEVRGSGDVSIAEAARVERMIDNGSGSIRVGR
jgi:hypothetical protein